MGLGLAQLARRAFPEWGVSLETLIVAMIGVHEVAGPICFRTALVRAGEVTEGSRDVEEFVGDGPVVARRGGGERRRTGTRTAVLYWEGWTAEPGGGDGHRRRTPWPGRL